MSLPPIVGHAALRERIRRTAGLGLLPQSLLFHGPDGVGKERLALWVAALIQCERPDGPCGTCRSCRLVDGLAHPDVHWFFPLPRPKNVRNRKLREKLEEARLEELAARRERQTPPPRDPAAAIYLPVVAEIRSRAARRPAMGEHSVFVIGDAERMVPQAASQEAANAFLKLLEEPPDYTFLLLTSSRPSDLLPTIRSRVLAVRAGPLRDEEVAGFLETTIDLSPAAAARIGLRSRGSLRRALMLAEEGGVDARESARRLLTAAARGSRDQRLRLALGFGSTGARGRLTATLDHLIELLRDQLGRTTSAEATVFDPEAARSVLPDTSSVRALLQAVEEVEDARTAAGRNVNPQAIVAAMLDELAACLQQV
ncbi:MAG: ATP-binding protein [Gemmatimonadota bacterium]